MVWLLHGNFLFKERTMLVSILKVHKATASGIMPCLGFLAACMGVAEPLGRPLVGLRGICSRSNWPCNAITKQSCSQQAYKAKLAHVHSNVWGGESECVWGGREANTMQVMPLIHDDSPVDQQVQQLWLVQLGLFMRA